MWSQLKIEIENPLSIALGSKIEKPLGYNPFKSRQRSPLVVTGKD